MDKTRMQQYMSQLRAMFNKHALYSDESPQYQIPFEPNPGDTVKIRFRTLKNNVDAVYFISGSGTVLIITRSRFRSEMSRSAIFLRFRQAAWSVITTSSVSQESCRRCTLSALSRASIRRTGRRALSCIRFLWTASATEIRPTMYKPGNTAIFASR